MPVAIHPNVIRDRLSAAIHREGMGPDRERAALAVVRVMVPEVIQIIAEELKRAQPKRKEG